jgi:hypothetical protein
VNKILISALGLSAACGAFAVPHYPGGITVTTSNAYSLRSAYDASDIITNLSPMNEDLALLKQHQKFGNATKNAAGLSYPSKALLEVSAEAAVAQTAGYGVASPVNTNVNTRYFNELYLSAATINLNAFITPWLGAFVEVSKNSSAYSYDANMSRAWLTIGNLDASPFYFTGGRMKLPFGKFSSSMATTPVTKAMFAISAPVALLGYSNKGLYAETYINSTDKSGAMTGNDDNSHVSFGANTGYNMIHGNYNLDLGLGYNYNINDGSAFTAATGDAGPWSAIDVHAEESLQLTNWNIGGKAEFLTALGRSPRAPGLGTMLTYNGKAAMPMALDVEFDASTKIKNRPFGMFLAYGQTWQAVGLNSAAPMSNASGAGVTKFSRLNTDWTNIPQYMAATGFNVSVWQDTIESVEYRHNFTYKATGKDVLGNNVQQFGKQENIVTMQIAAYL